MARRDALPEGGSEGSLSGLIEHAWKKTWLIERELGNAQRLLREFETTHQARRGGKYRRPARADKGRWSLVTFCS